MVKVNLPKHLSEEHRKELHGSKYWNGRYAQSHPNMISSTEQSVDIVLTCLARAIKALAPWAGKDVLPMEAAPHLRKAFETISDLDWHLPEVEMWCCWTEYLDGWSDRHVVWSAHFTEAEAKAWLPHWQKKFADRNDYGWHVSLHPCNIAYVMDSAAAPERFVQ